MKCRSFLLHRTLFGYLLCVPHSPGFCSAALYIILKQFPSSHNISYLLLPSSGGRNLPRSLLGPTAGSDSEGGVFAVPTTLPPNSSRHNRMFSPNKEAELAFRQQLDSISVRQSKALLLNQFIVHVNMHKYYCYMIY